MKSAPKKRTTVPPPPPKGNKRALGNRGGAPKGANSSYKPEYAARAAKACELGGATDSDLAELFGVSTKTIHNWRLEHPEFLSALKDGKDISDARVEQSLYHRAMGYSYPAIKFNVVDKELVETPYTEHVPPDVTACIFWLKNRQVAKWRDRRETEHDGNVTVTIRRVRAKVEGEE